LKNQVTFLHSRRASGELGEVRKTSTSTKVKTEVSIGIAAAAAEVAVAVIVWTTKESERDVWSIE